MTHERISSEGNCSNSRHHIPTTPPCQRADGRLVRKKGKVETGEDRLDLVVRPQITKCRWHLRGCELRASYHLDRRKIGPQQGKQLSWNGIALQFSGLYTRIPLDQQFQIWRPQ